MPARLSPLVAAVLAPLVGCGLLVAPPDGGDAGRIVDDDAGVVSVADAGSVDGGLDDAGSLDGGHEDAGHDDAGPLDGGHEDALHDDAGDDQDAGVDDDGGSEDGGLDDDAGSDDDGGTLDGGLDDDAGLDEPDPTVVTPLLAGGLDIDAETPVLMASCAGCDDVDDDGLNDLFEDRLLRALRPVLMVHPDEPALADGSTIALVGRVFVASEDPLVLHAYVMIGWSEDYGSCGLTAHHGDSERYAVELTPVPDDTDRVVVSALYTAAHEGTVTDRGRVFRGSTLLADVVVVDDEGQPRFALFPSLRKHATYANATLCDEAFALPCFAETCTQIVEAVGLVPPVVNAGEPDAPRVTALDDIGFAGEDAWADERFCGGLGGTGCSSPVVEKLTVDPFAE